MYCCCKKFEKRQTCFTLKERKEGEERLLQVKEGKGKDHEGGRKGNKIRELWIRDEC